MRPSVIAITIVLSVSAHAAAPSFVSVPAFGFDARPQAVAVADFDEDGNADAVAASAENGVLFVLIGDLRRCEQAAETFAVESSLISSSPLSR